MKEKKPPKTKEEKRLENKARAEAIKKEFFKQCKMAGLPLPETEYKFHPVRKWRLDYFFPSLRLAVEQEGGIFIGGRHSRGIGMKNDMEKYNSLTLAGISLLRFQPKEIKSGEAVSKVVLFSSKGKG